MLISRGTGIVDTIYISPVPASRNIFSIKVFMGSWIGPETNKRMIRY